MAVQRIALYPGTFDPLTNGHLNLVERGLRLFDKIIVAVAADTGKNTLFSLDERVEMAHEVFKDMSNVEVAPFKGLLVEYAKERNATILLRGLRAVSDYEYEFQSSLMNNYLNSGIETIFLVADFRWLYISSTIIKAAAHLNGDVGELIPPYVFKRLRERYKLSDIPPIPR